MNGQLPECWGHRGASAEFPENTFASFEAAIAEGSDCIESDVHTTSDDRILMFHDVSLERTTDGSGIIAELPWEDCISKVRTLKAPHQPIPLFEQALDLLMRPDAKHIKFNVDIKPSNEPERLFELMARLVKKIPNWETDLAPRLILGLWHPSFILPAKRHLPTATLIHITASLSVADEYFFPHVTGFSVAFPLLLTSTGQRFLDKAKQEGKSVGVWTVNRVDEMCVASKLGCQWILTDRPAIWRGVRDRLGQDFESTYSKEVPSSFWYSTPTYYLVAHKLLNYYARKKIIRFAGPLVRIPSPA
ncbi:Glycerophosphoryl diester phosphodiesterase [Phaffia rhodozyma]|uniref:Glycerophosphoryl diester phosphodiesterase n=1 Tax=Phaffia rhodozyma TaxID=264483 RepID=A0A0F7SHW6_PHARH|nr:Glycerophosphoryl diester phosphodiesterase [Phaffia rhodozyma]